MNSKPAGMVRPRAAGLRFYATLAIAAIVTFALHEAGHWIAGVALGYDMVIRINEVVAAPGSLVAARDAFIITAAGPAATVLQAVLAFALIRTRDRLLAYPFLFAAWFMRFAAAFVSLFHPNDEARLSLELSWNMWLLPSVVVLGLLLLTWLGARRLRLGGAVNMASYVLCSVLFAAIVFGDAAF